MTIVAALLAFAVSLAYADASPSDALKPTEGSHVSLFKRVDNNYALLFLGTTHTVDPDSPTIAEVKRLFDIFKPTTVLVEGGEWDIASNARKAVEVGGEMGFVTYLANEINLKVRSLEPAAKDEVAALLKRHSPTKIKLYYALRQMPQLLRDKAPGTIDQKMDRFLMSEGLALPELAGPPSNSFELGALFKARFPDRGDWRTYDWWREKAPLTQIAAPEGLADIYKDTNQIRDDHMEKVIRNALDEGRRVFVIAGNAHLAALYPRLSKP